MKKIFLNNDWSFSFDFNSDNSIPVRIPHSVKETAFHYFSEDEYQTVSKYEKTIFAPIEWLGNKVLLTFDGVAHYAEVFIGGKKVGEHKCGYTAFTLDISEHLVYGDDNLLMVKVDSRESLNIPPFGHVIDYMTYGGIYRDVYIEVKPSTYISDVFAKTRANGEIVSEITVFGDISSDMRITQSIIKNGCIEQFADVEAKGKVTVCGSLDVNPWDVDTPNMYILRTELWKGSAPLDVCDEKIGFRDAEFRNDGFYLNGKKLKLRGLNRHQSYPYVGYAMPRSMQEMDADVLKNELGLNTVRTSHYPQSHYFLDRCDEIGLVVITEIPGWQHIGDEIWQDQAVKNVEEMILQYRNHPSIILWGVRINESQDNDALYTRTNELAHRLDPTRSTCGVRNFRQSRLLEDVYTYNDFIHDGEKPGCEPKVNITSDTSKPYMVTEYGGHMYPTKSFDCESHRVEHALRHARVLDAIASHEDIAGSCGWCMADYNTHKDFGSGDRICYHGVTDMFRNHKLAAAVYSSQGREPVLEISSSMDIGEYPACIRGEVWAFTNADSIKTYKDNKFIKEYFSTTNGKFTSLKHNPILIDGFVTDADDWGGMSTGYRFDAIINGEVVSSVTKTPMTKGCLKVDAYKTTLIERESYDVAAIRIRAVDEYGNTLHFSSEPLVVTVDGPACLIGPSVSSLKGGMGGVYVKTVGKSGRVSVTIHTPNLGDATVFLDVMT